MKAIYKYELEVTDDQILKIKGTPISTINQNENIVMYTLCNPREKEHIINIHIAGTGHPISDDIVDSYKFLGTVPLLDKLVFHIFYREEDNEIFEKAYESEVENRYQYC